MDSVLNHPLLNQNDHPAGTRAMIYTPRGGHHGHPIYCEIIDWSASGRFSLMKYEMLKGHSSLKWLDIQYFSFQVIEVFQKQPELFEMAKRYQDGIRMALASLDIYGMCDSTPQATVENARNILRQSLKGN